MLTAADRLAEFERSIATSSFGSVESGKCPTIGFFARLYSITLSAAVSKIAGTVRLSAFAAFRLMTSSKEVGCWIGRSAGLAPLRTFPTKIPAS